MADTAASLVWRYISPRAMVAAGEVTSAEREVQGRARRRPCVWWIAMEASICSGCQPEAPGFS